MQEKRYPRGHFMAVGMAIGIPLGLPIGLLIDMIVIGPLIGVAIGAGIGAYMEKKYNPNPLPISVEDDRQRKKIILALAGFFLLGLLALIALLMMI
ncbi:DUF1269 domain-containing protein [Methanolobus chelungpuianus]|uniref:Uncharacterized protein n=1 Tax=Methanolobus chelungpuianus TaxID=502115 RepID=A0AAE3HAG4_9EURY|nr:DUF1269 domain-containing protein [Methanolobus chelungpuianus]MCQ6962514.1 hypothetical protein [Methanolobus chelungpuianus]